MNNKGAAYEQYIASQPVVPRPQHVEPEPLKDLTTVEITVLAVFVIALIYAVYRIIQDPVKKPD
jgi:hypothetical protein